MLFQLDVKGLESLSEILWSVFALEELTQYLCLKATGP